MYVNKELFLGINRHLTDTNTSLGNQFSLCKYLLSLFLNTRLLGSAHLQFQLLIVALSVNIFSLYSIKQKQKKFVDLIIIFRTFLKFYKNKKVLNTNF